MLTSIAGIVFSLLNFVLGKMALSESQRQAVINFAEAMAPTLGSAARAFKAYQGLQAGIDAQRAEYEKNLPKP